jgi:hypothetical protein
LTKIILKKKTSKKTKKCKKNKKVTKKRKKRKKKEKVQKKGNALWITIVIHSALGVGEQ